ncbi:MAG: HAD family hydrolase [Caldisericia bacterium]|nr:HAD family hydrolase [Caldisericia bacterium]MDD4614428.1 HAD family hydrolase [Caldisericia bacterium]
MLKKKSQIQVLSFDIFRTLVDLDSRAPMVYERIHGKKGTRLQIRRFWSDIGMLYRIELNKSLSQNIYEGFAPIFVRVMGWIQKKYSLSGSAHQFTDILMDEEKKALLFPDALETVSVLSKKYSICLVSDTDPEMVTSILPKIPVKKLFLSCDYQAYKEDSKNTLFQAVLDDYKIDPSHIMHIGDSYSDVFGSKRANMNSIWINRYMPWLRWKHADIKPDYTISSLYRLTMFL